MSTQTSFKQVEEEEEESGMFCPDCNSNDIVETHSDYCCRKCGAVVERRMESTHFLSRSSDGERSGSPESIRSSKSTSFRVLDAKAGEKREKWRRLWKSENSQYCAISENKSRLLNILTNLGLSETATNEIMFELKKTYSAERRKGNKVTNIFLIGAAITLKQLKNKKRATSINTIVSTFKNYGCKLSSKSVRDYIMENNIALRSTSPAIFVNQHMGRLRNSPSVRKKLSILTNGDDLELDMLYTTIERMATKLSAVKTNGRKPSVLSASCIYLAAELLGIKIIGESILTKDEMSRICKIPTTTMRAHVKYLKAQINIKI